MKLDNRTIEKEHRILTHLAHLPKKIVTLHGHENIPEFVLHDLCQADCFNLNKAAYFVDNPDFNCTKGVSGFSRQEAFPGSDIWKDHDAFSNHMRSSSFNQQVRGLARCSIKKHGAPMHEELAAELAKDLGFSTYAYCSWGMKHDNEGFVVYEKNEPDDTDLDTHLIHGLTLLSFCPIY
jgi:hypothetical protein